ncbi:MAG: hypothetical protein LRS43_01775, partial [Desulfurococcales archaeon]|nr:hypothetical protein [Desulfurococcales archaeon]
MGLPPGRVTQVLAVIGLYIIVNSAMELWPLFSDLRTPLVALIGVQLLSLAASLRFPVLYILFSASIIPGILLPVLYGGRLPQPLLASWIAFTILGEYRSISRRWGVSGGSGLGMGGVASILGFLALLAVSGSTLYLLYYGVLGSLEGLLSRIGGDVRLFYGILSLTSLFTIALALAVVYVYYRLVLLVSWLLSYLQPGGARLAAREYELEAGSERENLLGMKGVQYRGL